MVVVATWITTQLVFDGVVAGLVIGLLAMGIVLVYRSTRVINFAVGNMGLVGAGLLALLRRRLRRAVLARGDRVALVVGTLLRRAHRARRHPPAVRRATRDRARRHHRRRPAVAGHRRRATRRSTAVGAAVPVASIGHVDDVARRPASPARSSTILVVVPLVAVALGVVPQPHDARQGGQGVGREPRPGPARRHQPEARLDRSCGPSPGSLATLSMILIAGQAGSASHARRPRPQHPGPGPRRRGDRAAWCRSRARSSPASPSASVEAVVRFNFLDQPGLVDFLLFLVVLVAVCAPEPSGPGETQAFSFTPKVRGDARAAPRGLVGAATSTVIVLGSCSARGGRRCPLIVTQPSRHLLYATHPRASRSARCR